MTVNLTHVRQIGVTCTDAPCESVQAAMRAGRLMIDALVKGAAVEALGEDLAVRLTAVPLG